MGALTYSGARIVGFEVEVRHHQVGDLSRLVDTVEQGRGLAGQLWHQRNELFGGLFDVGDEGFDLG